MGGTWGTRPGLGVLARTTAPVLALLAVGVLATGPAAADQGSAAATTYFVSGNGNDANNGSSSAPWRTIARAVRGAPAGGTINVRTGTYQPFTVTKARQVIQGVSGQNPTVVGRSGAQDVIRVAASGVTVSDLTVSGCVPDPSPPGGFEDGGSSAVRVDDGADNVTIDSMTIRNSRGTTPQGLRFGCYGILVHYADGSVLTGNDVSGTGDAIYFNGGGTGARVQNNRLHDNDVIIRNTMTANDDFGGTGITFSNLSGSPGPRAVGNTVMNNAGPSHDYGYDGGAFEIYNASNVVIDNNDLSNNENVLETGTFSGGACQGNVFTNNQVDGRTSGSTLPQAVGMILRCATGMQIESNTFSGIEQTLFFIDASDVFSTNVNRLTIRYNTITSSDPVYYLAVDPSVVPLTVNANRFRVSGPIFANYSDGTSSRLLSGWQSRTGLDRSSTTF